MKTCIKFLSIALLISNLGCKNSTDSAAKSVEATPSPSSGSTEALKVVNAYYAAFQAADTNAMKLALNAVFDKDVTLDSPLVIEKYKKVAVGIDAVTGFALVASTLLKGATVRDYYISISDPWTIATIIDEPNPCVVVPQSEYFKIDPVTHKIKSIYSNYDPRTLISLSSGAGCPKAQ
ncbi:MAG: hypothetical protein NTX25_04990 [Proteobacteria bacterium]|nr:hypothetical protein [Pseudomonadota bacterium]